MVEHTSATTIGAFALSQSGATTPLLDAHLPYLPPREFLPRSEESPLDISSLVGRIMKGRGVPTEADRRALIRLYDAEIAYVDTQVGRFPR